MKIRNETKVGLLAVVSIVLLIFGYSVISGNKIFSSKHYYYAQYKKINGLQLSNPVMLNGYKIGEIENIGIENPTKGGLLVRFSVKKKVKIPKKSVAKIYNSSLLGSKALKLELADSVDVFHKPGDTMRGENELTLSEQLSPIRTKADTILSAIDTMVSTVNAVMREGGKQNIKASLANFRQSIENLNNISDSLNSLLVSKSDNFRKVINNTAAITDNLKANTKQIDNALNNFSNISDSFADSDIKATLAKTDSFAEQLNAIAGKVNEGNGSAAQFINNDTLYNNLEKTSRELDNLVKDLQNNPAKYLNFSIMNINKDKEEKRE